ncbi:coiled-coil alpha-helical rod protein 1-like isoform X2 [Neopsephotus bourkii]|uniref:coiled-coil alpha-helical rod protein 1-like isoform X2 n=1 Tax=Neopsephotus bourkii TaxID=309878 RepID=UPI002AA5CC00|nr:coiled-coil alpha-helical rod protein 1-like isoform X2 [Neopsephotus bourkii]XP_061216380.1 coiled-coil alpha-helical rod protein 1-like isoform X2 [Neopsephotus bourkii]
MAEQPPATGLIPPSHFMLRPPGPSTRTLEAELEAERRRNQALGEELEAERRRSQALGEELEAERRRSQALEVELEGERRRSQDQGVEPIGGQPQEAQVLLQARLSAMGHILALQEKELSRALPPPGVPLPVGPPRLLLLLGCWREKVFGLLVQLRVQEELQRALSTQVSRLGAAVAAGTRRVTRLELRLKERMERGEEQRREKERLAQEVTQQRARAEAAEEALGELAQAAASLARVVAAHEAAVAAATRTMETLSTRLRRAGHRLRVLQGLMAPVVPLEEVTPDEAPPHEDRMGPPPSRAALGSLVMHLQALGASILRDNGDPP